MAPKKKQKLVASSSATYDSNRFWNEEAATFHASYFKKSILRECGFDMSYPDYVMLVKARRRGWEAFVTPPADAVKSLVREFYANLKVRHENFRVLVRGKRVAFDSHTINTLYTMPDINDDDYSKYLADHLDYSQILNTLCRKGVSWRTMNNAPVNFITSDMHTYAKNWFLLWLPE